MEFLDIMKYYLIAGEASGDLHASNLMRALCEYDSDAQFRFFGGDLMQAVGGALVKHYRDLAYMGFVQVALHAGTIMRGMALCKKDIVAWLLILPFLFLHPPHHTSLRLLLCLRQSCYNDFNNASLVGKISFSSLLVDTLFPLAS